MQIFTQKTVFLLCEGYLPPQPSFVYLFCKKGDFFGPIHGYTLQNDHFYLCILVKSGTGPRFVATSARCNGRIQKLLKKKVGGSAKTLQCLVR